MKYLVVANQTLGGEHLFAKVRDAIADDADSSFHVLVPASRPGGLTWTEGQAIATAQGHLDEALARFREAGVDADGEVGDEDPAQAIADVLLREPYDQIIISTLPHGRSNWLRQDLVTRVASQSGLPVTHVVGDVSSWSE